MQAPLTAALRATSSRRSDRLACRHSQVAEASPTYLQSPSQKRERRGEKNNVRKQRPRSFEIYMSDGWRVNTSLGENWLVISGPSGHLVLEEAAV